MTKHIITDNCGRFYRKEIDGWTCAREAATEYTHLRCLPLVICKEDDEPLHSNYMDLYASWVSSVGYYDDPLSIEPVAASQEVN